MKTNVFPCIRLHILHTMVVVVTVVIVVSSELWASLAPWFYPLVHLSSPPPRPFLFSIPASCLRYDKQLPTTCYLGFESPYSIDISYYDFYSSICLKLNIFLITVDISSYDLLLNHVKALIGMLQPLRILLLALKALLAYIVSTCLKAYHQKFFEDRPK